jgi:hypothetical protein
MNANDPEFYQASKFEPDNIEPPRGRGCFFYGCVFAGVGVVIMMTLCGVGGFFAYKAVDQVVAEYTGTEPVPLPKLEVTKEQQAELRDRVAAFRKALDSGEETPPLELSGDDVNALIEQNTDFKDKIYVTLEGDKIKGKVSLPLDKIGENVPIFGRLVMGRYLNGEAELKASLQNGEPIVHIETLEVNGKDLPEEMMKSLRIENLAKDAKRDPKNADMISKLESVEVKDGKVIIKARAKDKRAADADAHEASPKPSEDGKTPAAVPAKPASPAPAEADSPPAKKAE